MIPPLPSPPLSPQNELVNAIIALDEEGEAPVETRLQKEFLRDLLLAQGVAKTPSAELEDLLARYYCMVR